ncbi:MAG: hypothetical protein ACK4RW_06045 [Rehaibacterium terrae]|uniref:hypothetical protein n=1 Tax=Rehaibacterium terrae TaxID=1341696 RepID=UPI00391893B1
MKMTRHFFISTDLDDLERLEQDLEQAGIVAPQIHLLTLDDTHADRHTHLHKVTSLMKQDIVHSTLIGAAVGLVAAVLVLAVAYTASWTQSPAGWLPFIFLAIIALGFFAWEGGLWGIQTPNVRFRRFEQALREGKHVFFVDLEPGQSKILEETVRRHPGVVPAGTDIGAPHWIVMWQYRLKRFFTQTFP